MTVQTSTNRADFAGNGSTTVFPYTFRIPVESYVRVYLIDVEGVETLQTLTTHYTVSGIGTYVGGNVTMVTAPPAGTDVSIRRVLPLYQLTDLRNLGRFSAELHEDAFDYAMMILQQIQEQIDRTSVPATAIIKNKTADQAKSGTNTVTIDGDLVATLEANSTYAFDCAFFVTTNALMNVPIGMRGTVGFSFLIADINTAALTSNLSTSTNVGVDSSTGLQLRIKGLIQTTSAGTFGVGWAADVSGAHTATMKQGSFLSLLKKA